MKTQYWHCKLTAQDIKSGDALRGMSFFSASPFIYKRRTLVFSNPDDQNIPKELLDCQIKENIKNIRDQSNIEAEKLNEYLPSAESKGILKVYNVGQAECSYFTSGLHKIMFDIGIDKEWLYANGAGENCSAAVKKNHADICKCNPKVMFLSHWDADHIIGVSLLHNGFPNLWVAPDILERKSIPIGIARLHNYLCYKKQLLTISNEYNGKLFFQSDFLSITKEIQREGESIIIMG